VALSRRVSCALVVLAWLIPSVAAGQTPARVFVEAAADSGAAVTDLRAEELEVREGGERRDVSALTPARRPIRLILLVDSTEAIRQPIGQIRRALTSFLQAVDPQHEAMLLSLSGTMQVRVPPTTTRQKLIDSANEVFGTSGGTPMYRAIEESFRRFGQTTMNRPVVVVVTAEGFMSMQQINPQQITKISDDIRKRGGVLHAVRLLVPVTTLVPAGEQSTELPVSMMIARGTGGTLRETSPNGLADVLQQLAVAINQAHERTPMGYQVDYASAPVKGKKPAAPELRATREGVRLSVFAGRD
jgi:hypothetical protein